MKKILVLLLALALLALPCAAETEAVELEYACEDFTLPLPDGMEVMAEDEQAALAAGAQADVGLNQDVSAAVFRGPEGRGVCISVFYREGTALEIAAELSAAMALLADAEVAETVRMPLWTYDAAMYTVVIEGTTYIQTVVTNGETCILFTTVGMQAREVQSMLDRLTIEE